MNRFQYLLITLFFNLYCALADNATVSDHDTAEDEPACGAGCVIVILIFACCFGCAGCAWFRKEFGQG